MQEGGGLFFIEQIIQRCRLPDDVAQALRFLKAHFAAPPRRKEEMDRVLRAMLEVCGEGRGRRPSGSDEPPAAAFAALRTEKV